jgi:outer membrane protein OmpA-like peptidoglycan-associated protein
MRRSTLILWTVATVLAVGAATAPAVKASSEDERPGEIGILAGVGLGEADLVGNDNNPHVNALLGGRFAWHFNDAVSGYFDGTWVEYTGDSALFGDVSEYTFRLGPEWYVNPASRWQFFVNMGVGAMYLKSDLSGNDNRGFASVGLGARRGWQPGALRLEFRADHTVSSSSDLGGRDFSSIKAMMGWTWGIGARPTDSDEDGVFDKKDKCPGTPHGAIVDKDGCPSDSDGDGVWNGIDQCPDTPKGWPVDATGCPIDTDGDAVFDGKDKCPNTPKGCTVNAEGCPADADGDGVCDGIDKCPGTPSGCRVDSRGCTVDSDGDGVCDGIDQCPGTASGIRVDVKGCPPPPPPPAPTYIPEPKKELVLERVFFDTNRATLKPESAVTLDKVAASLKDFPDVKIQVAGHTDNTGSDAYNLKLSEARASSVMNYLVSKGVNPAMLSAKGYGESEPVADNKTADGRAQNRRVGLRRLN